MNHFGGEFMAGATLRKVIQQGQEIFLYKDIPISSHSFLPGTEGYLIYRKREGAGWGLNGLEYIISPYPARKEESGSVKVKGWLGSSDGVSFWAEGKVKILSDRLGRLRLAKIPDPSYPTQNTAHSWFSPSAAS